ncbi:MAG TPA: metallophosphoesterase [Microvirga sp.]|jgi:3',5'-cyclic AMP phosphodiesterase CpdA|nr:metallophosphoesterase [Microvirga sp.]
MYRIAHLTDPHVGPLPRPKLRHLLSKRITGYVNWRRSRSELHDMELLAELIADMKAQAPDHIVCTGDTCNIGLPSEWESSREFMEKLGAPDFATFVPGNHDAYVPGSLEGLLGEVGAWASGDGGAQTFPFVRRRGAIAFVGLSSAIPTLPFVATGRVGSRQSKEAEAILTDLGRDPGCFRIVLIHHPPHRGGAESGRELTDARRFEGMIARTGAELVLHGHNHVGSVAFLPGPRGRVPVIGAPSASARGGALVHKAGYHLFTIGQDATGFFLTAQLRGLRPDGTVGDCGMLTLNRPDPVAEVLKS